MSFESRRDIVIAKIRKQAKIGVNRAGIELQRAIKLKLSGSAGRAEGGEAPAVKTGHLRRSIMVDTKSLDQLKVRVGPQANVKYARIQEFGGKIYSKDKLLTVPMNDTAKKLLRDYGSVREIPDLFVIKTANKTFLCRQQKRLKKAKGVGVYGFIIQKQPVEWLFQLRGHVRLPARPYMRNTWGENRYRLRTIIDHALKEWLV